MGPLHGLPVLRVVADWLLACVLCADSMLSILTLVSHAN
jgi:hypothetical protein